MKMAKCAQYSTSSYSTFTAPLVPGLRCAATRRPGAAVHELIMFVLRILRVPVLSIERLHERIAQSVLYLPVDLSMRAECMQEK